MRIKSYPNVLGHIKFGTLLGLLATADETEAVVKWDDGCGLILDSLHPSNIAVARDALQPIWGIRA